MSDRCTFERDGLRCVEEYAHVGNHRMRDGEYVYTRPGSARCEKDLGFGTIDVSGAREDFVRMVVNRYEVDE